jgi:glycerol-3-phosphate O-acyltransferase / dihydroxyacetone phosphate acyltransferase
VWLLPVLSGLSHAIVRVFYRFRRAGGRVPRDGPVLLVANHPNSLMDPALVAAAAGRPVRFLAKAPLFHDRVVGWLVRGAGAVPLHRSTDDPRRMAENELAFREVHAALAAGSAVGIFPEGVSHDRPALAPLRSGAARMALGGAAALGTSFPIVPVGIVLREKGVFRSEALAVVGAPLPWDDLAGRGDADPGAVGELTERIARALARVTVNLERWEDRPLVETAEAVYAAELPHDPSPAARVARLAATAAALARLRAERPGEWEPLAREVRAHGRVLRLLGMSAEQLRADVGWREAGGWTVRLLGLPRMLLPFAAAGAVLFWIPYRATGALEARAAPDPDVRATWKVVVGTVVHLAWVALLASAAALLAGWRGALAAVLVLPLLGLIALHTVERGERAAAEARRFLLRHRRREAIAALRERQASLAARLRELWEEVGAA